MSLSRPLLVVLAGVAAYVVTLVDAGTAVSDLNVLSRLWAVLENPDLTSQPSPRVRLDRRALTRTSAHRQSRIIRSSAESDAWNRRQQRSTQAASRAARVGTAHAVGLRSPQLTTGSAAL